jgi:hypothetical protein
LSRKDVPHLSESRPFECNCRALSRLTGAYFGNFIAV